MNAWTVGIAALALAGGLLARHASADIQASASITSSSGYYYPYHYDITLHNTGDVDIGTFWFAWDDSGLNFLPSYPYITSYNPGWYGFLTDNYGVSDATGYGIEWYGYGTALTPGDSMTFSFESYDSPAVVNGISPIAPVRPGDAPFPVLTSFVYQKYPAQRPDDPGFQFVVSSGTAAAPEPASLALLGAGVGVLFLRRRQA